MPVYIYLIFLVRNLGVNVKERVWHSHMHRYSGHLCIKRLLVYDNSRSFVTLSLSFVDRNVNIFHTLEHRIADRLDPPWLPKWNYNIDS